MAHAIARIAKLKAANINSSELHVNRERETPNANKNITNIRFIGEGNRRRLNELVRERIGEQTIRKNAVLCVEMLLTASPEYFRPEDPSRAGYYKPEKLESWQQAVREWLDNEYGDRIVRAELHLDESTPHIHAYLVPLDERGKLNCRGIFGGRQKLSQFQDSYANAMSPLGLERGIKGSRAKHTKVNQYYAAVNSSANNSLDKKTIEQQLADRTRAIAQGERALITAKSLSNQNENLLTRLEKAEMKIKSQDRELQNWKTKYTELADGVRDLPLNEVAYELGLSPSKDKHKWKNPRHTITITGSKFYDWKQMRGGGGSIDLVMQINECDFKQAVVWLSDRFGEGVTIEAVTQKAREIIQNEPVREFVPPVIEESKWSGVKEYLTRKRLLPSSLIDKLHDSGLIYADSKQNAVFLRRSLDENKITGASLRGTVGANNTFKGLAKGTKRSEGWFYFERGEQSSDSIKRVVLVESPIDAMSLAVMERTDSVKTLYLSTDGAGQLPLEFLQEVEVAIAFDNDEAGEEMAAIVKSKLPKAVRKTPSSVDWNQDLVNSFDWLKTSQNIQTSKEPPERSNSRGLGL